MKTFFKIVIGLSAVYLLFYFSIVSLDAFIIFKSNLNIANTIGLMSLAGVLAIGMYYRFFFCASLFRINIPQSSLIGISAEAFTIGQLIPGQLGIDGYRIFKLRSLDSSKFKKYLISTTLIEKFASLFSQLILISIYIILIYRLEINILKTISLFVGVSLVCFLLYKFSKYIIKSRFGLIIEDLRALTFIKILMFCLILNLLACSLIYSISVIATGSYGLPFIKTSVAMLTSNISAVIPITPNGLGISEFVFSKTLSIIIDESKLDIFGSSYLIYRIINIFTHLLIYLMTVVKDFRFHDFKNE